MVLDMFLDSLLVTHSMTSSTIQIVQDNARVTSTKIGSNNNASNIVPTISKSSRRWYSSCLDTPMTMTPPASFAEPEGCRWKNVDSIHGDSFLIIPQRRSSYQNKQVVHITEGGFCGAWNRQNIEFIESLYDEEEMDNEEESELDALISFFDMKLRKFQHHKQNPDTVPRRLSTTRTKSAVRV